MRIPEYELWKLLNLFKALTIEDYNVNSSNLTKTFLYDIFGVNDLNEKMGFDTDFNLFKESHNIFSRTNRQLSLSIGFNQKKATTPSIHIILPSENPIVAGIGQNEGYVDPKVDVDTKTIYGKFTANSSVTYNLIITSDNMNEVVILYHWLKACFLSLYEQVEFRGFQNCVFGGSDINISDDLVPPTIFYRNFNLSFSYDWTIKSLLGNRYPTGGVTISNLLDDTTVDSDGVRCPTLQEQLAVALNPNIYNYLRSDTIVYLQGIICDSTPPVITDTDYYYAIAIGHP